MCVTQASATRRGGRCSNNNIAMRTSLSSVPFGLPLWTSLFASYQPEQVHHRSRVISMKVTNMQTLLLGGVAGSNGPSVLDTLSINVIMIGICMVGGAEIKESRLDD